ncbi:MAG: Histidinol dehydrogenase [Mycoplasmataceae bacterium]|nr:MAG: Histidinol dehydrogenase [Mycoplasmataceae bacterium]
MNIFEIFKKNGNKFLEKSLMSVFKGMDKQKLDFIFLWFLEAFDVEGANILNVKNMKKKPFQSYAANEIVKQLITEVQKKKLTDLMSQLKKHDSFFVNEIDSVKEEELESNKGTVSREIFMEVEKLVPDALTLLALIKVDPNDFQESYNSLAAMWKDLFKDPKNEEDKKK